MEHIYEIIIRGQKSDIKEIKTKMSDTFKDMGYELESTKTKITIRCTEDWQRSATKHEIEELSKNFPKITIDCHSTVDGKHGDRFDAKVVEFTVENGKTSKIVKPHKRIVKNISEILKGQSFKRFILGGFIGMGLFAVLIATLVYM